MGECLKGQGFLVQCDDRGGTHIGTHIEGQYQK